MTGFSEFLRRNTVKPSSCLPLVHTTRALHIKHIVEKNKITTALCDVFNDQLGYFFVGRPAYKHNHTQDQAAYWELPACFIVEFQAVNDIRRVYPFDTGAHHDKMMPTFIQCIDKKEYEVVGLSDAPQRIIGAFFGNANNYFSLSPKEAKSFYMEYSLGVFDEEIKALHMLASAPVNGGVDDRRLCIEVQSGSDLELSPNRLLAVVCPSIYLDDPEFRTHVETVWDAEPISYNWQPLNYGNYISQIYEKVELFFRRKKILKYRGKRF
jgi:hypothetical protein